jgi:hypothetical protein
MFFRSTFDIAYIIAESLCLEGKENALEDGSTLIDRNADQHTGAISAG